MIKLNRGPKPAELTDVFVSTMTEVFKASDKKTAVWNQDFLKRALLNMSNNKCSYCEASVSVGSSYVEVEHFRHKDVYEDEVLSWENLLPACKRCNSTKRCHDTGLEPIINPTSDEPKDHLAYSWYRLRGIDSLGDLTISVLNLNDQQRLITSRFLVGDSLENRLEDFNLRMDEYLAGSKKTKTKNAIVNGLKQLMDLAAPSATFAATTATVLVNSQNFVLLKQKLTDNGFWDADLSAKELIANKIALRTHI